jgi:hypothetical protein
MVFRGLGLIDEELGVAPRIACQIMPFQALFLLFCLLGFLLFDSIDIPPSEDSLKASSVVGFS